MSPEGRSGQGVGPPPWPEWPSGLNGLAGLAGTEDTGIPGIPGIPGIHGGAVPLEFPYWFRNRSDQREDLVLSNMTRSSLRSDLVIFYLVFQLDPAEASEKTRKDEKRREKCVFSRVFSCFLVFSCGFPHGNSNVFRKVSESDVSYFLTLSAIPAKSDEWGRLISPRDAENSRKQQKTVSFLLFSAFSGAIPRTL